MIHGQSNKKTLGYSASVTFARMYKRGTFWVAVLIVALSTALRPTHTPLPDTPDLRICLRWSRAYPEENWGRVRTGLLWTLSHLGAELPKGQFDGAFRFVGPDLFILDLGRVGFSTDAQRVLMPLLDSLRRTEEYRTQCAIDVGRWVVLMAHTPAHYYAITGAAPDYATFRARHALDAADTRVYTFPVVRSSIANGNRLVAFREGAHPTEWAFVAAEGTGRLEHGNFQATEYEAIDIMPNGQLRFAIYDAAGRLEAATPTHLGEAGKPGKCMWCHESSLQVLYTPTYRVPGHLTPDAFVLQMQQLKKRLLHYQLGRGSDIQFQRSDDHTEHELLYITFMEPSVERLSQEWGRSVQYVRTRLRGLTPHTHAEFGWLGPLYHRADVDRLAPYAVTPVPDDVREPSRYEPDFLVRDTL
jgi:hypothetical protein